MTKYSEYETIRNGKNTVVKGKIRFPYEDAKKFVKITNTLSTMYSDMFVGLRVTGVAKLDPSDEYDAKKGLMIASRKCELKALKKAFKEMKLMIEELGKAEDLLYKTMLQNEARSQVLEQELEELKK